MNTRHGAAITLGVVLCMTGFASEASRSEATTTAREGILRCGGSHHLRQGGSELHFTSYPLRNFDSTYGITINRIRVWDAAANVIFDSAVSGLPPPEEGSIVGNTIPPNGTAQYGTFTLVPGFLGDGARPVQVEFQWSAPARAVTLDAVTVRLVRARDPVTGAVREERSRHANDCRSISLK